MRNDSSRTGNSILASVIRRIQSAQEIVSVDLKKHAGATQIAISGCPSCGDLMSKHAPGRLPELRRGDRAEGVSLWRNE